MKKSMKLSVSVVATLCIQYPIWFWLLYQVLQRVEASKLMMFLYWIYIPASVLASLFAKLWSEENDREERLRKGLAQ